MTNVLPDELVADADRLGAMTAKTVRAWRHTFSALRDVGASVAICASMTATTVAAVGSFVARAHRTFNRSTPKGPPQ